MTLTSLSELLAEAGETHHAVGAFNVVHLETAEALAAAAEETGLPVILQISENCVSFHGSLQPIGRATLEIAERSSARIAVHLDHAESPELARLAVDLGFSSVMYDGSRLDDDVNREITRDIVRYAHRRGAAVEAELGEVGGKDGAHAPGVRTDPAEARAFVEATGVDALAVAVGSSHAMTVRNASIDLDLVARLRDAAGVPLVLHGSSGVADEVIVRAIAAGIRKVNVSTHLNGFYTREIRDMLIAQPDLVDSRTYTRSARAALALEAARLLRLFAEPVALPA